MIFIEQNCHDFIFDRELKLKIFSSFPVTTFQTVPIFRFNVAGLWIQINYQGEYQLSTINFLKNYFTHFKQDLDFSAKSDFIIHYQQPVNEYGSSKWKYWNEWGHEIEFSTTDYGNYDHVIARDFVGYLDKTKKEIFVIGPELSFDTCDSIDNVLSYMIGHHLISQDGVILHAACTVFADQAYVFFGASGVGKSTIAEFSHNRYEHGVISSDQVIIRFIDNKLYAELMPTTIPEFSLHHPARVTMPIPIRGIFHLIRSDTSFHFRELEALEWIRFFMRELVYRPEFGQEKKLLDVALRMAQDTSIVHAEFSYEKDSDFFTKLYHKLNSKG